MPEDAKQRAASTYNTAADAFDDPPLSFWDYFGKKTVDRLSLQTGARVLDVCCGSGASAIPAAEVVGPSGLVIGVDLADKLLELARAKAQHRLLQNISFQCADMLALDYPGESFDAVICVFGIFFVPDMSSAVRELWHFVRPGGKLAITTWGSNVLEPANSAFWPRWLRPNQLMQFFPTDLSVLSHETLFTSFSLAAEHHPPPPLARLTEVDTSNGRISCHITDYHLCESLS
jgi:ubiquinone/menaquinone biosynthesis C-methylase UbiE